MCWRPRHCRAIKSRRAEGDRWRPSTLIRAQAGIQCWVPALAGTSGIRSSFRIQRRKPLGFGKIIRRVDIKERIERSRWPFGDSESIARAQFADFAHALAREHRTQILTQRHWPERDDRMAAPARSRAGNRRLSGQRPAYHPGRTEGRTNGNGACEGAMPRGSKPGERRGGRQRATPNKRTVLTDRILAVVSANPTASLPPRVLCRGLSYSQGRGSGR